MTPINLEVLYARHSRLMKNTVEKNIGFLLVRVGWKVRYTVGIAPTLDAESGNP